MLSNFALVVLAGIVQASSDSELTIDFDSVTVVEGEIEEVRSPNEVKFKWDWGSAFWTDRDGVLHEKISAGSSK